jgi:hypothetical protein
MSSLYRLPLFHFEHEDPATLELNGETILAAIKLSSTVFFRELGNPSGYAPPKRRTDHLPYLSFALENSSSGQV